ncbi:MAG: class I SAM-dependent methyltransferase [bacterium]
MAEKWHEIFNRRAEIYEDPLEIAEYCWGGKPVEKEYIDSRIEIILKELEIDGRSSLLEVGSGCNILLSRLKEKAAECYGVEPAAGMILAGRRTCELPVVCAEASRLPFPGSFFDRTLSYNVFAYLPDDGYAVEAMMEMVRVTKPGGIVFIGEIQHAGTKEAYVKRRAESSNAYKPEHYDARVRTDLESLWYFPETFAKRLDSEGLKYEVAHPHPGGGFLSGYRFSLKIWI